MANSVYPLKINGYIYSPKTRQGFLRMRRMGIPRPLFSIENELAKTLASRYKKLAAQLLKVLKDKIKRNGLTIDRALVADGKTKRILQSFTIDKKKFFDDNMDEVRRLYVQNSLERIDWEQEDIKRAILKRITDYAMNRTDELKLDDLTKDAFNRGEHLARLFARDQMARFNKACTLATFRSAGVTKVQWLTANDGRVRETHRMLNKKIFDVDNLPKEINDYNCRCGLVPVEWADD